jgi:hypothetical protein
MYIVVGNERQESGTSRWKSRKPVLAISQRSKLVVLVPASLNLDHFPSYSQVAVVPPSWTTPALKPSHEESRTLETNIKDNKTGDQTDIHRAIYSNTPTPSCQKVTTLSDKKPSTLGFPKRPVEVEKLHKQHRPLSRVMTANSSHGRFCMEIHKLLAN